MNASCALQHFCDIHGPQILLCTEGRTYVFNSNDNDNEDLKTFYSQYIRSDNSKERIECKSCTLSSESSLISTIDFSKNMLYISSASTPNQELFKNIRNACVRSLNIEKSAENNHPILFGDDDNGYCLSLTFSCKDFHARGSQRLYSLCYLCHDKFYLISLMNLISNCMRETVHWLQTDANQTYEREGRIQINTNLSQSNTATYICRPPPRTPSQRMLSDVVHDSNLIHRIHALFVWILRTTNSAINESLFDALPTEDDTTKQERKDIIESEPILIKQRSDTVIEQIIQTPRNYFLSSLDSSNYFENHFDDEDDYDSLDYQFSTHSYEAFYLFKQFIQKLTNPIEYLQYILSNWSIGNQIIIKYMNHTDNIDYPRAFASIFRLFLPDGCCHLTETLDNTLSCTANLILIDMNKSNNQIDQSTDTTTIVIDITFERIDEHIRITQLEISPPIKSDLIISSYVKTIIDVLMDNNFDEKVFEAIVTQEKIKYLNKAKLYFQLGRCQIASVLSLSERQQLDILHVNNSADLLLIRFWQKGVSQTYKTQIRMLKQNENQEKLKSIH